MDSWQLLAQLKKIIEDATWSDTAEKFVRAADITPLTIDGILQVRFAPSVIIALSDMRNPDPLTINRSAELVQNVEITLCIETQGDQVVTASIMGKDRGGGPKGKGLLEFQAKLLELTALLTEQNAVNFSFHGAGAGSVVHLEGTNLVSRVYRFDARITQQRTYDSPTRLRASGNVSLTWSLPADRFDRKKIVLRRSSSGGSAPQAITEGTGITLASDLAVSVTDGPLAAGTYWYSVFCQYDDLLTGVSNNYNNSPPYSWKVVVA
jgi:hypothetical protein